MYQPRIEDPIELYNVKGVSLTRTQVIEIARRAGVTSDELAPPVPRVLKSTPLEITLERSDGRVVRMVRIQDTKYGVVLEHSGNEYVGALANLATGIEIPPDEPVMIFRAKDVHANHAINAYLLAVTADSTTVNPQTIDSAHAQFMRFNDFARDHADRMRAPT